MFGALPGEAGPQDRAMAERMMAYFVNFATTGNPNGPGLPRWPAYEAVKPKILVLARPTTRESLNTGRYDFIRSLRRNGRLPENWRTQPVDKEQR